MRDNSDILDQMEQLDDAMRVKADWQKILFTEWEMSPLQELYFTHLAETDAEFANAVTNDVSDEFKAYIKHRILRHANCNIIYVGEQGCGKSTFSAATFLYSKGQYKELAKIDVGHWFLTFTTAETLDAYSKIQSRAYIFQDEDDDLQGPGSRSIIKNLGNIVKRVRAWEISLFICCPTLTVIPGCDYALMPFGFYKKGVERLLKTGDSSDCWARALLYVKSKMHRDNYQLQGCVFFFTGDAIEYMKQTKYHEAKAASYEKIKKNQGGSGAYSAGQREKLEEQAKVILKMALKNSWDGVNLKRLETVIELHTDIRPTGDELKHLKVLVSELYEKKKKKLAKAQKTQAAEAATITDPDADFTWDDTAIFAEIKAESKSDEIDRNIEIFKAIISGTANQEDFVKKHKLSPERIKQIRKEMEGKYSEKIGHLYEQYLGPKLKIQLGADSVEVLGGVGEPDIILKFGEATHYISVKCLNFGRNGYSLSYKECRPEIEAAQKDRKDGKVAQASIHVRNLFNKQVYEKWVESEIIDSGEPYPVYSKRTWNLKLDSPTTAPLPQTT